MQAGERRKKIEEAAAQAGYKRDLDIRPESLSAGEQKLIAFARAVICGPGVLFLDEWTESLDEKAAMRLVAVVRSMKESGVSVILVSHDPRIVRSMCDEVVFVSGGRISASLHVSQIGSEGELGRLMETGAES
jgi:ABC-type multidrug transport system ATPase subunit